VIHTVDRDSLAAALGRIAEESPGFLAEADQVNIPANELALADAILAALPSSEHDGPCEHGVPCALPSPEPSAALNRILGAAEEVTIYQHGNPVAVLDDIVKIAKQALAALPSPEPTSLAAFDVCPLCGLTRQMLTAMCKEHFPWAALPSPEPTLNVERERVPCDEVCGAFEEPITFDEYRAAYEHARSHGYLSGCSHAR